jgi:hypothetical protein
MINDAAMQALGRDWEGTMLSNANELLGGFKIWEEVKR